MGQQIPAERGVVDLILVAMENLLVTGLQVAIATGDATRAQLIKVGPRQAGPESVSVLLHEGDPDNVELWSHKAKAWPRPGGVDKNQGDDVGGVRPSSNMFLVGGGSQYSRAFTIEVEIFGRYLQGFNASREETRRVASVVEGRIMQTLYAGGHTIGTGELVRDNFNEYVVMGPFFGDTMTEQEEGEALIVRKKIRCYYRTVREFDLG